MRQILLHWDSLVRGVSLKTMWTDSAYLPTGVQPTVQTLQAYNTAHADERYTTSFVAATTHLQAPILPFVSAAETKALHDTTPSSAPGYCAILPGPRHLPQPLLDNIAYRWTPLRNAVPTQYIHRSQLEPTGVTHVLAMPFDPLSGMSDADKSAEVAFVEQAREHMDIDSDPLFRKIRETLHVPDGQTRYLFIHLKSRRINQLNRWIPFLDNHAQFYQPDNVRLYTCLLPSTVTLQALCDELRETSIGGERFAFRQPRQSAFVRTHHLRLYEEDTVNATQKRLYTRVQRYTTRTAKRLKDKQALKTAEEQVRREEDRLARLEANELDRYIRRRDRQRRTARTVRGRLGDRLRRVSLRRERIR